MLGRSAVSAGVAAAKGEEDKDVHHDELVQSAGGIFVPLLVESLGLWPAANHPVLQDIALRTTTRSGISQSLAHCHLLEQLSVGCGATMPGHFYTFLTCCLAVLCGS